MLARIALRIAAVEALKGKTQVGDNVFDSRIGALDVSADGTLRTNMDRPFIVVYSEAAKSDKDDLNVRNLYDNGLTELLFETGVTTTMTDTNQETGESVTVTGIPASDEAFEFLLDMVVRQIVDALGAPDDEWADIFRDLIYRVDKVERARTSGEDGTRFAAQQINLTVELIEDPVRGEPLDEDGTFARFLAKLETMPTPYPIYAAMMRAQIEGENKPWETVQRRLGLTRDELQALGFGLPDDLDAVEIAVEGSGTTVTVEPEP